MVSLDVKTSNKARLSGTMDVSDIDPFQLQHGMINQPLGTHFLYGVYAQGTSDFI